MRAMLLDYLLAFAIVFGVVGLACSVRLHQADQTVPRVDTSTPWCWSPKVGLGLPCYYKSGDVDA